MDGNLLVIIGIISILFALILIVIQGRKEKEIYKDILVKYKDIKDYTDTMEEIVDNMDTLIDTVLQKYHSLEEKIDNQKECNVNSEEYKEIKEIEEVKEKNEIENVKDLDEDEYKPDENKAYANDSNDEISIRSDDTSKRKSIKEEIRILKESGLSNQQIAKKLGKGIREIDIISKMIELKNSNGLD